MFRMCARMFACIRVGLHRNWARSTKIGPNISEARSRGRDHCSEVASESEWEGKYEKRYSHVYFFMMRLVRAGRRDVTPHLPPPTYLTCLPFASAGRLAACSRRCRPFLSTLIRHFERKTDTDSPPRRITEPWSPRRNMSLSAACRSWLEPPSRRG